jgi:prepilin-type N-terminal cleavage/methylation domain-containing protein
MKKLNTKKGFSLIELLVVIAIIGVLSAVGITAYTGYTASAKEQAARTQFAQVVSLLNAESAKCGVGTGSYAWGDACTVTTLTVADIRDHLYDDLGMKNPYNNSQGKTDFIVTTGSPDADGEMALVVNGTEVTIRQQVKSGTTLEQVVDQAS